MADTSLSRYEKVYSVIIQQTVKDCQRQEKTIITIQCKSTIHLGQLNKKGMKDRATSVKVELR
ncbi:hypothetical protein, partial [Agathobaculum sp. Marseille-P7918]|uniref:hypothetical protein n=1 Tax=Agathobaculum sp. Marseille-P7918 TaxID=2479843 RepID=UPI0035671E24